MIFGKTIKIFIIDGEPNGRMSCELSNWSGKAYKVPRFSAVVGINSPTPIHCKIKQIAVVGLQQRK